MSFAVARRLWVSLLLAAAPVVATAQNVITLRADSVRRIIAPSSKLAVPVILDMSAAGGTNLASLTTAVAFGTSRLTFDSVRTAGFGSLASNLLNAASGSLTLGVFDATGTTTTQTFATMYFTTSATTGGTTIAFNPTVAGTDLGASIISLLRARNLDVCVAPSGKWGDVNGDSVTAPLGDGNVDIIDAQQLARYSVGLPSPNRPGIVARGDVTNDGAVNIIDAQQVARFSVGLGAAARVNTPAFTPPVVASVTTVPNTGPSMVPGATLQVTATARDAGNVDVTPCTTVTWASTSTFVVTVSSTGLLTAIAVGTATVTATSGGQTASLFVTVSSGGAPSALVYSTNPAVYTKNQAITNNTPSSSGGAVTSYSISATFSATGLSFSTATGIISGTPTALSSATGYTVTATNSNGSTTATVTITVRDVAPSALVYSTNPATYMVGQPITSNTPSSSGGPVTSYAISAGFSATGLAFNTTTGVISGAPSAPSGATGYTVTATNSGGSTTATLTIAVTVSTPGVCTLGLSVDRFASGEWARTSPSVTIASGKAVIQTNGAYGDGFSLPCATTGPWQLDVTARIVSGGQNYVFPSIVTRLSNGSSITATSLPDALWGWLLKACDSVSWPVAEIVPVVPGNCTSNQWNNPGPASVAEGQFMTLRIVADGPTLRLFAKPAGQSGFVLAHEVPYTTTGLSLERIAVVQSWDAQIEVTELAILRPVVSVTVAPSTASKTVGGTQQFTATLKDGNDSTLTGRPVIWSTGNASIAAVNSSTGVATAISVGITTITATSEGKSGTATITVNDVAPAALVYATNPAIYTKNAVIANNTPSSSGGAVVSYSVSPALPAGLSLSTTTGVISGTPTVISGTGSYTVTATNTGGSATVIVSMTVNDVAPAALVYAANPVTYTVGQLITNNTPSSSGGPVTSYSISAGFGATGLTFSTVTGVLSGTPTAPSGATGHTVTATNSGGSTTATVTITINAGAAAPGPGDVAVAVTYAGLAKLRAADGTLSWSAVRGNCGGIAVDPIDYGVYFGNTANCAGGTTGVFKYSAAGAQLWNATGVMTCGSSGGYYIGNGGVAVDATSAAPGVILTLSGFYGNVGKVSRTNGSQIWCNGTNDLGRPSIDPATGQSYAITNGGHYGYKTMYINTLGGAQTSATVRPCEGFTDLNPADGALYNGGGGSADGCGLIVYKLSKTDASVISSINLSAFVSSVDAVAVQPWVGGYLFAASALSSRVVVIDPTAMAVVTMFNTAIGPSYLAVNPSGGNVYVASSASNYVYAYTPTGTLVWTSPNLGSGVYNIATVRNTVGLPASSTVITAPTTATISTAGLVGSVPTQSGATYAWTIIGGTITAGAAGNQVTFTAGTGSSLTLNVTVTSSGGIAATGTRVVTLTP